MPPPTSPPQPTVQPIQFTQLTSEDLKSPETLNTIFSQVFRSINQGIGAGGPTPLLSGANVAGKTISGIGEPQSLTDAVSKGHAEANYSAAAIAPQLEQGSGKTGLKSYRAINSKSQQESYSTFLNKTSNVAPTTSDSTITSTTPSGGTVTITVPAGNLFYVDGSQTYYNTFTLTVPTPSSTNLGSISRAAGVVTATPAFLGSFSLVAGEPVFISGVSDISFNGSFILVTANSGTITWDQPNFADGSSSGGSVTSSGCYYLYLENPSHTLAVSGPFASDSQQNRLAANNDGQVLVVVAVINSTGLVAAQSAGGATIPIVQNNGNRILGRL